MPFQLNLKQKILFLGTLFSLCLAKSLSIGGKTLTVLDVSALSPSFSIEMDIDSNSGCFLDYGLDEQKKRWHLLQK